MKIGLVFSSPGATDKWGILAHDAPFFKALGDGWLSTSPLPQD